MNWQSFIKKLEKDFRISDNELELKTSISSKVFYNLKKGATKKPNQVTIKKLEEGLNIKIDDSDTNKIAYSQNLFDENIELFNVSGNEYPVVSQILGEDLFSTHNIIGTIVLPYSKKENCFVVICNEQKAFGFLRKGDKVLIDIDSKLTNDSLVAARLKSSRQLLKYYRELPENFIQFYSENISDSLIVKKDEIEVIYSGVLLIRNV
ncbi:MAG: hypothetical protein NTX22_03945 [Ignavibacteriales bacterium]|nr:hypothetical protein [Ignavibacteriales bacterium]